MRRVEEAQADLLGGLAEFQFMAVNALQRLDEEQALSDRLYDKCRAMGMLEWEARRLGCKLLEHRWQNVQRPITINRWCARCYEIEDRR